MEEKTKPVFWLEAARHKPVIGRQTASQELGLQGVFLYWSLRDGKTLYRSFPGDGASNLFQGMINSQLESAIEQQLKDFHKWLSLEDCPVADDEYPKSFADVITSHAPIYGKDLLKEFLGDYQIKNLRELNFQ